MSLTPHPWTPDQALYWCGPGCFVGIDAARLSKRARKYGIRTEDLAALVYATGGYCMVCRRCHAAIIEHCHETGHVRGLVCGWCNGRLKDIEAHEPGAQAGRRSCSCLDYKPEGHAELWRSAYAYLDHASDVYHLSIKDAFTRLATGPYPENAFTPPTAG